MGYLSPRTLLALLLAALAAVPAPAAAPADAPEADTEQAAQLAKAEALYAEALTLFKAGDADKGRARIKKAFVLVSETLQDDSLAASLQAEFAGMIEKIRNWEETEPPSEEAPALDVPVATAAVRMRGIKIDADNPIAQQFIEIYKRRPRAVEEALGRSGRYRRMIRDALKDKGLPEELLYLVMAESEFKPDAVSRSGAAGLWQFMPGTARKYGLEVSYWVDERFDPEKATPAALRYLGDLYQWFGDWNLAIAAYNRGEGGLGRDMQYSRSPNFESLSGRKVLPNETHHYVPKFMACALIGADPEKYGFRPKYEDPAAYDSVAIARELDLGVAARCAGTTESEIRRLNPQLKAWCTPKDRPGFALRIPKGSKDAFLEGLAKVSDWNPGPTLVRYRVRRGDFLGKIARDHHTTVKGILATNKIKQARLIRPGMVLLIRPGPRARR